MKRVIGKLLVLLLCFSCALSVSAAEPGSLLLTKVEKPVMLVPVADAQGVPLSSFADVTDRLTADDLKPELAGRFYSLVKEKTLSGQTVIPNENDEAVFLSLAEGWYLVCGAGEAEFSPFLLCIPMTLGDRMVYDVQAEPKIDTPSKPTQPTDPTLPPQPDIPQTGAILWPKYVLMLLGCAAIVAGLLEVLRGRKMPYE